MTEHFTHYSENQLGVQDEHFVHKETLIKSKYFLYFFNKFMLTLTENTF